MDSRHLVSYWFVSARLMACIGGHRQFYVVGIGASAGGLEALEAFFANMPVNSGMAFIVVQHLSPNYKSMMTQLLAKHTAMVINKVKLTFEVQFSILLGGRYDEDTPKSDLSYTTFNQHVHREGDDTS